MKTIGLVLLVSVAAFGQKAGVRPYPYGNGSGFGNVVFPGTGHAPAINHTGAGAIRPGYISPTVNGVRPRTGNRPVIYVPYSYGGLGYYSDPYLNQPYINPPEDPAAQQMPPQVVINQTFVSGEPVRPVVRDYVTDSDGGIRQYEPARPTAEAPAQQAEVPTYLIAFKDHTIYAALAYWVEGDTLHYVTNQNTHNQVSLDLIDRDLSLRFNRERNVEFHLPPAR